MGHRVGMRSLDGRGLCGIYHQFRTVCTEFQFVFSCAETIEFMEKNIEFLENLRVKYNDTKDKTLWYSIIQLLPESYNQMRTCTFSYENAVAMYYSRKNHKLDEWHTFCDWVTELPYFKELFIQE